MRLAIAILLLCPAVAWCQETKPEDEDNVSNDQPARPLQMPPASTEVKEALDDFARFQRRGAWERALKALYTIPEEQTTRFIDGTNGFIIPVARKRRSVLTALPPQGQAAYRLFYDAEAKKLFDESGGPNELKTLERIYSAYFTSSVGDNAADRLGDLYFELGHFDRAADCWMAILHDRPDTDISPGLLTLKAGLALHRARRDSELAQIRAELRDRHTEERLTLGGLTGAPGELLDRLIKDDQEMTNATEPAAGGGDTGLDLAGSVEPAWQMRFAASVEAGMSPAELTQWESNPMSAAVPAVAIGGQVIFVNYVGYICALDLNSGKLLWRSAAFHHLDTMAMQNFGQGVESNRYAILAGGDFIWTLGRDAKDQNLFSALHLACRRAASGEVVWQSNDLSDYAQIDLAGKPLLAGSKLFIAGKGQPTQPQQQGLPQQLVLAIQPHDGKVVWKTEVATFRQGNPQFFWGGYMPAASSQPQLLYRSGTLYLDTQIGVFARLDAESGAIDWGYGYKTDAVVGQNRFFFWGGPQMQDPTASFSRPIASGDAFLVKGTQSTRLCALAPNRMKVLWDRPVAKASRLLGTSGGAIVLGGGELSALDLESRQLLWSTPLPNGSMDGNVLVRSDGIWQLTPRGIFEIDPKTGAIRRIFRGSDLGAIGGDLVLTDRFLLAVSNRTISAYPRRAGAATITNLDNTASSNERASK
jgi:outer membrane protein assembly factor BamB